MRVLTATTGGYWREPVYLSGRNSLATADPRRKLCKSHERSVGGMQKEERQQTDAQCAKQGAAAAATVAIRA